MRYRTLPLVRVVQSNRWQKCRASASCGRLCFARFAKDGMNAGNSHSAGLRDFGRALAGMFQLQDRRPALRCVGKPRRRESEAPKVLYDARLSSSDLASDLARGHAALRHFQESPGFLGRNRVRMALVHFLRKRAAACLHHARGATSDQGQAARSRRLVEKVPHGRRVHGRRKTNRLSFRPWRMENCPAWLRIHRFDV